MRYLITFLSESVWRTTFVKVRMLQDDSFLICLIEIVFGQSFEKLINLLISRNWIEYSRFFSLTNSGAGHCLARSCKTTVYICRSTWETSRNSQISATCKKELPSIEMKERKSITSRKIAKIESFGRSIVNIKTNIVMCWVFVWVCFSPSEVYWTTS